MALTCCYRHGYDKLTMATAVIAAVVMEIDREQFVSHIEVRDICCFSCNIAAHVCCYFILLIIIKYYHQYSYC